MRRLVAVLGAVLMVVVAVLVRGVLDGDDADSSDGGGGGSDGEVTLLCIDELEDVCRTLRDEGEIDDYAVEAAGETVDRMLVAGAELGADGWLTLDSFPQQVDELRQFEGQNRLFGSPAASGRTSGVAIVAADDRGAALTDTCDQVDWACLEDLGSRPWVAAGGEATWGSIRYGYDRPDASATGLLVLAQAMATHLGDPAFAGQDIDRRWLTSLERGVPNRTTASAIDTLVLQGPAAFGAVGALGADAEAAAQSRDLTIFYPAPMYRAEIVLAAVGGDADRVLGMDEVADAAEGVGWEGTGGEPLPSPGTLFALRQAWEGA